MYFDGFMVMETKNYTDSDWAKEALSSPEIGDYEHDIWQEVYTQEEPEVINFKEFGDKYAYIS